MVSFGPNTQSLNYTHMSEFQDLKGALCIQPTKNTVWDYIYNHPQLTKAKKLIIKANLVTTMNNEQYNTTVFLANDSALAYLTDDLIKKMDIGTARNIILASSIHGKIDRRVLKSSYTLILPSKIPYLYIYANNTNNNTTLINGYPVKEFDIRLQNGMIHLTSNLVSGY